MMRIFYADQKVIRILRSYTNGYGWLRYTIYNCGFGSNQYATMLRTESDVEKKTSLKNTHNP